MIIEKKGKDLEEEPRKVREEGKGEQMDQGARQVDPGVLAEEQELEKGTKYRGSRELIRFS